MIAFSIVATLLVAGAALFLLPPLLNRGGRAAAPAHDSVNLAVLRDQLRELDADLAAGLLSDSQYGVARAELEQRVVEETAGDAAPVAGGGPGRGALAALVLAVPALAVPLYLHLGTPEGIDPQAQVASNGTHSVTREQIVAMVDQLAARLDANPDDNEGWAMLARSYNALGRYAEAAVAFRTLSERLPEDAQLLADYADTLAMAQGRSLRGEPERLIARALEVDGNNLKALALAGTIAFDRQDYKAALRHWERIVTLVPADSNVATSMQSSIAEARRRIDGDAATAAPTPVKADAPIAAAAAGAAISGRVTLDPVLAARVAPDDTVFVFARALSGPKMPLAILRKKARELPFDFTLDDSTAMSPQLRLSGQQQVIVGARISRSGDATSSPGDLEGYTTPTAVGSEGLLVSIEREVR